ncbi:MAG TPA: adenylate/guanylate cyclase domain-containing protein [Verrucomicrobiota bacterium]|nr:adenylate/guanylate cyclase domain-containing protein [Verrucomicrobiota bacterium]HNU52514.1 adenylate/guanylate cyclase domain-containing protein [Verrucomicrobiota bacterium]
MNREAIYQELSDPGSVLSTVLDSIFDGVYIVDRERRIIFWNRAAEQITGHLRKEVMGRCCHDSMLNHIDEQGTMLCFSACPLQRSIQTGESLRAKVYPMHKDGRRFPVYTHIGAIRDESGAIIAGIEVFRDISQEEDFRLLQEKFNELIKRYVSTATLEEVMEHLQGGAEGHARVRELTVMYLDVVGFTAFSERNSPEAVALMLNELFGVCEVITRECHGDIDKFIGDAIMAVFIDPNDAVAAGRKVLSAVSRWNETRYARGLDGVRIRVGINSGAVIQGEIGTASRKDVTVIGDVVNTAARIESVTDPMCLGISEATYARLRDPGRAWRSQTVQVKNRQAPVTVYVSEP